MSVKDVRIEERDGVKYAVETVKNKGSIVGLSPTRLTSDLDEMLEFLSPEKIHSLARRQLTTDHKNEVRAKFTKDKVSASAIVKAIASGTLLVPDIQRVEKEQGVTFTDAGAILMGVGDKAKVDPEKIHWDVIE